MSDFANRVWKATKKIPVGKLATYGQLAVTIGCPGAARAVGNALHQNPYAPIVPCHRVVKSTGEVGGFADGPKKKIALLKSEGIEIVSGRVVNLEKFLV